MRLNHILGILILAVPLLGQEASEEPTALTSEGVEFFENNVRPILVNRCYTCHSAQLPQPMGSLLLDSRAGILRGGAHGPAIVPGEPEESLLIKAVKGLNKDFRMPPVGNPLEEREVEALEEWIRRGAPDPRTDTTAPPAVSVSSYDWEQEKKHWAYQPIEKPRAPEHVSPEWRHTAVDRFIKAKLDANGLSPAEPADKNTLIRRATYDLTGLPPTPREIRAFLEDKSENAFEKVIDRLLASPQYGERWGRHWMDVVRYADTAGDNSDFPVPSAYRYRNYIIDSFNADKPYDHFLREQLAGDLLPTKSHADWQENVIATGYLASSRRFASRVKEFHLTLNDTIANLGKGLLGLTVECARCHDHKYDPIPQKDYYALYGIFQSSRYAHAGVEETPQKHSFVALGGEEESKTLDAYETELTALHNKKRSLSRAVRRALRQREDSAQTLAEQVALAEKALELAKVERSIEEISENYLKIEKAYAVTDIDPDAPGVEALSAERPDYGLPPLAANARIMVRGDPEILGEQVPRGFLTILGGKRVPEDEQGSGRRQLAEWITDPENPLVPRVMVNRIWAWHFGRGVVATTNNFGSRGETPSHPKLLDYLASCFVDNGWSIKKMHRLIMLTRIYQSASAYQEQNALKDPGNRFLWRFNPRRLDAEEIRDALLAVSGNLDYSQGGEHPFPPEHIDKVVRYTQHEPFMAVYESNRRSVYLMQQRIRRHPFFALWDGADTNSAIGLRPATVTPLQSLYVMNNPFVHQHAEDLAIRIYMARDNDTERLRYAYELFFARFPTPAEIREAQQYLMRSRGAVRGNGIDPDRVNPEAWASLMRVLISSNEFLTLD